MTQFIGKCRGGPYNGRDYCHWSRRLEILTPAALGVHPNSRVIPSVLGVYEHYGPLQEGVWYWCQTSRTEGT